MPDTPHTRADGCLSTTLWAAVLGAIAVGLVTVFHPLIAARLDSVMLPVLLVAALGLLLWWRV